MASQAGYIYAIGAVGTSYVKIGSARDVEKRRKQLQIGQPFHLQTLAAIPVTSALRHIEKQVHAFLEAEQQRGEWFEIPMDHATLAALVVRAVEWKSACGECLDNDSALISNIGERILILRRRCGLTQRELAKEAGLNTNTIARLEQGSLKDLGGQAVVRIARVLDTTADYLLGMTENEEPRESDELCSVAETRV